MKTLVSEPSGKLANRELEQGERFAFGYFTTDQSYSCEYGLLVEWDGIGFIDLGYGLYPDEIAYASPDFDILVKQI